VIPALVEQLQLPPAPGIPAGTVPLPVGPWLPAPPLASMVPGIVASP
jgi:hypothetical protein